jgi:CheY-like chemotaxis protein
MIRPIAILVVEDNLGDIQLLKEVLVGYRLLNEISWSRDGEEALKLMQAHRPDLVILDTLLPGKSGFEVLEEIRDDESLKDIYVVMASGSGDLNYVRKRAPGADAFLEKPITLEDLVATISQVDRFAIGVIKTAGQR